MPQWLRRTVTFFLACLFFCLAPAAVRVSSPYSARVVAAEADPDILVDQIYQAARQQLKDLESSEDLAEKRNGYEEIIARFQNNGDPLAQRFTAHAMRKLATLERDARRGLGAPDKEDDRTRMLAKLDEMIAKYETNDNNSIMAEVLTAKLAKADIYFWSFENRQEENDIYNDVIAAVGDNPDKTLQQFAAYAMSQMLVRIPLSEREAAGRRYLEKYGSNTDPYVKKLVAESMDRLSEIVATEAEKNAVLVEIIAAYQGDGDPALQSIVAEAKKSMSVEGSFDVIAVNSRNFYATYETGSLLRQAWLTAR